MNGIQEDTLMMIDQIKHWILGIVSDTPVTADEILKRLGSETSPGIFKRSMSYLTHNSDIHLTPLSSDTIHIFTAPRLELGVDVPVFLQRQDDETGLADLSTDYAYAKHVAAKYMSYLSGEQQQEERSAKEGGVDNE